MDKRATIALLACLFLWLFYLQVFLPWYYPPPPKKTPEKQPTAQTEPGVDPSDVASDPQEKPAPEPSLAPTRSDVPVRELVLETDEFRATFSSRGACLVSYVLKRYLDAGKHGQLELLGRFVSELPSWTIRGLQPKDPMDSAPWEVIREDPDSVSFRYVSPDGFRLEKTFAKESAPYTLRVKCTLSSAAVEPIERKLEIFGAAGIRPESPNRINLHGVKAQPGAGGAWSVEDLGRPPDLAEPKGVFSPREVTWIGVADKYFASVFIPDSPDLRDEMRGIASLKVSPVRDTLELAAPGPGGAVPTTPNQPNNLASSVLTRNLTLASGDVVHYEFLFFAGPQDSTVFLTPPLDRFGLEGLRDFGWFGWISRMLLGILKGFYALTGNYGLSIIFLVILVRLCLFPLTRKGQMSLYRMQKLSPKIKVLQERYGDDRQKLNVEVMKIYREYGVNPMGGCMPLLLQIPVFIGLYRALDLSLDLRHAPFVWWIQDLSQPEAICPLPFSFLGIAHFRLLPILMTITWLIQSATQPKAADPQQRQQQKMMMFMPIVFAFMFYNMQSGLNLYWFVSTLLGIGEQAMIKRMLRKQEGPA